MYPTQHGTLVVERQRKNDPQQVLQQTINTAMDKLAKEVEKVWHEKAAQELSSTLTPYIKGLKIERDGETITGTLTGWMPVALETGKQPYDLKPGFLQQSKPGKTTTGAQYRIIPMGQDHGNLRFRTVSTQSEKTDWWHPGFQARALHKQVEDEAEKIIAQAIIPAFNRLEI